MFENIKLECGEYRCIGFEGAPDLSNVMKTKKFYYLDDIDGSVLLLDNDGLRTRVTYRQFSKYFRYVGRGVTCVRVDTDSWYYKHVLSKCEVK